MSWQDYNIEDESERMLNGDYANDLKSDSPDSFLTDEEIKQRVYDSLDDE